MIQLVKTNDEIKEIVEYIGNQYKTTPYLYVNTIKYGTGTEKIHEWIDRKEDSTIGGIYLLYYDCLHFFTKEANEYSLEKIMDIIELLNPKVVMVKDDIGQRLPSEITNRFDIERNHVIDMDKVGLENKKYLSVIANLNDIDSIVDLLMNDPEYVNVYVRETLREQLYDRFNSNFSRYFVVHQDGKVVATCSTYGEVPGFALVGGVIVDPNYRRRGYAGDVEKFACHILQNEGLSRVGFVNFNNKASLELHESLGAFSISILNKFVRK